jgi:DNA modification methylase
MADLQIEYVLATDLVPYENNSRTHSQQQVDQIKRSMTEFGFTNPILIDERNGIIAGHGRLQAAQELGIKLVPTIALKGLTEAQRKAYVIADNQLALNAGWDLNLLKEEIQKLNNLDFDTAILGFDDDFMAKLLGEDESEGLTDEDSVPDIPTIPVTVIGDIWTLGKHRLMCGDSTKIDDVDLLMNGDLADMVWTDPPYNVAYQGGTSEKLTIQNDNMSNDNFRSFLLDAFLAAYMATKDGRPIYIAHADSEGYNFRGAMVESGWLFKQCIIWVKNSMVLGRQDYQWQHEPILYGWKPGKAHTWYGDFDKKTVIDDDVKINALSKQELVSIVNQMRNNNRTTVVREDKPHRNDIHPTMKPVRLVVGFINNSSREQDIVLDLFGGGGSTLIAAQQTNRISRLMELDPKYCDVIITRWQEFTGKQAVHETGKSFAEIAMER